MSNDLDESLAELLSSGWNTGASESPDLPVVAADSPEYPPLPARGVEETLEPQPHGGALRRAREADVPPDGASGALLDIGLLTDLAVGRTNAAQAAAVAGVTEGDLHRQLAATLREVDPKEIAKALGLQAAEQQLKSGAVYGAVLADLVNDLVTSRLKPDQKIELAKMLARVGRIEPKDDKGAAAGGAFVLNINLGNGEPKPIVIDAN